MTDPHTYKFYLRDLGDIIRERALEAKREKAAERAGSDGQLLHSGRLLAFNEVISIMQQQAAAFNIPLDELRLDGIEPDRDLV